jgi:hypothetical protein
MVKIYPIHRKLPNNSTQLTTGRHESGDRLREKKSPERFISQLLICEVGPEQRKNVPSVLPTGRIGRREWKQRSLTLLALNPRRESRDQP